MPRLTFQITKVRTNGPDEDGALVFADGVLIAVLVRLSAIHGRLEGCWHLEFAGGLRRSPPAQCFKGLEEASDWMAAHLRAS